MKRSSAVLPTRLRGRTNKPRWQYDPNEFLDDDVPMSDVVDLIRLEQTGQARYDHDDGRDYTPHKLLDVRINNSCLEYQVEYVDHPGRSWVHASQFDDDNGEDRGWNWLVVDFWARCHLDPSLTDIPPPDPLPQPRVRNRRSTSSKATSRYHAKDLRQFAEWKSLDDILVAGDLLHYKPAGYQVDLVLISQGIAAKQHQVVNELLTAIATKLFPNKDALVLLPNLSPQHPIPPSFSSSQTRRSVFEPLCVLGRPTPTNATAAEDATAEQSLVD